MKVLQINKYHFPNGGSETVYLNTCNLLTEHGHAVIHFSMKDEKNIDSPTKDYFPENFNFRKDSAFKKIINFPKFYYNRDAKKKIEQLIINEKPDIAHIHLYNNSLSVSIFQVLKKYNIPVLLMLHDYRLICPTSNFMLKGKLCNVCKASLYTNCFLYKCYQNNRFNSLMLTWELLQKEYFIKLDKYVDRYLFVSKFQMASHINHSSYYEKKHAFLYNFNPDIRKSNPSFSRGNYFFFYGRITEEKGIRTFTEIAKKLPSFKFKVAGTGPLMDELKRDCSPNIEFLGFQTGTALHDLIENASFVVVPSEWNENNPLTIIESYMYGKPVIASNIGGLPEIVLDNETGFLFQMKSVDDLSEKIQKAQSLSDDEYLKLSRNARNFAETHFDPEEYYQQLMLLYNSLIKEKKTQLRN